MEPGPVGREGCGGCGDSPAPRAPAAGDGSVWVTPLLSHPLPPLPRPRHPPCCSFTVPAPRHLPAPATPSPYTGASPGPCWHSQGATGTGVAVTSTWGQGCGQPHSSLSLRAGASLTAVQSECDQPFDGEGGEDFVLSYFVLGQSLSILGWEPAAPSVPALLQGVLLICCCGAGHGQGCRKPGSSPEPAFLPRYQHEG